MLKTRPSARVTLSMRRRSFGGSFPLLQHVLEGLDALTRGPARLFQVCASWEVFCPAIELVVESTEVFCCSGLMAPNSGIIFGASDRIDEVD